MNPDKTDFLDHFRAYFFNAGLFSFFINLTLLVPPLYMIQVFDRVLSSRSNETLLMLTLAAVGALTMILALDYLRSQLLLGAGAQLDHLLGERVIAGLIENATRVSRVEPVHGLRDVALLRGFLTGSSIISLFDAPWMVLFLVLIFLFHPLLGAVALAGTLALFLLAWANEKLNRAGLERIQLDSRRGAQFIDRGLRNAEVLNGLGMTEGFVAKWWRFNEPVIAGMIETGRRMGMIQSATRFLRQLIQVVMLGAGAYLVIGSHVTPGVMIATTIILSRALAPVESLITNWGNLVQARAAYGRLRGYFTVEATVPGTRLPIPEGRLSVERVTLAGRAPDRPILRQVTFELTPGESLAIVGPSASGKSSLARLLVGAWLPTAGCVRLDGADVGLASRAEIGPHLGYLPQDVELFVGTVSENIARLGPIDSEAVVAAAQRAGAHEMVLRLPQGYDTVIGEGGVMLSGGQMQRIGLARALYGNPRLVVLDEPNANLDAEGEAGLLQALADLRRESVTVVMTTHKPSLLSGMDKVLVMRDGKMDMFGPSEQVLARVAPGAAKAKADSAAI